MSTKIIWLNKVYDRNFPQFICLLLSWEPLLWVSFMCTNRSNCLCVGAHCTTQIMLPIDGAQAHSHGGRIHGALQKNFWVNLWEVQRPSVAMPPHLILAAVMALREECCKALNWWSADRIPAFLKVQHWANTPSAAIFGQRGAGLPVMAMPVSVRPGKLVRFHE